MATVVVSASTCRPSPARCRAPIPGCDEVESGVSAAGADEGYGVRGRERRQGSGRVTRHSATEDSGGSISHRPERCGYRNRTNACLTDPDNRVPIILTVFRQTTRLSPTRGRPAQGRVVRSTNYDGVETPIEGNLPIYH